MKAAAHWLLLVDNAPIREAALADYHRVEKQVAQVRVKLEAFETGDLPAYQRWEARVLGPLLTELRTLMQAIDEKRSLLEAIEEEMYWTGCNQTTAYRRVVNAERGGEKQKEQEHFEEFEDERGPNPGASPGDRMFGQSDLPPDFDIDQFDRGSAREKKDFREFYEMMAAMFEAITGKRAPSLDDVLRAERARKHGGATNEVKEHGEGSAPGDRSRGTRPRVDAAAQRVEDRIKELYRMLVRQLHPDRNHQQSERERELWHQVQEAYQKRDLDKLEALAGRIEIGLNGKSSQLPVQILRRMAGELRDALRGLQKQLNATRKHPAWAFREKAEGLAKFEKKRRRQLEEECFHARSELEGLRDFLAKLAARAERSSAGRKRKSGGVGPSPAQQSFSF